MRTDELSFVEQLRSLARLGEVDVVRQELENDRPEDIADGLTRLEFEEGLALLKLLDPEIAGNVLIELPTENARALVSELPDETLAHYLDVLPMDDALDLREELGADRFDVLLNIIPSEDAAEIRRLMEYPEESVGRLLTEDFFQVGPDDTMSTILADIRLAPEHKYETVNDVYVVDDHKHLLGVVSLRKVIRAAPQTVVRDIMNDDVLTADAWEDAEEAARRMARYGFYALPVLDRRGRMVGIFTGDDAQSVLREEETEDVLKLGAVSGDTEAYLSLGIWQLVKRRLPWLTILFVAEFFTGSVLRFYLGKSAESSPDQSLAIIAKLQLFVPLLIGAGGNAGSQVTTTITRALALGEVRGRDWWTVMRREIMVGLFIGAVLGLVGFLRAKLPYIGWNQPMYLSLIVGMALPCIVIWAATVGSMLPIGAKKLGLDPAVMSAPFITTFVDATGLVIYFEVAKAVLRSNGMSL
jgi:magnesium transporter